LELKLEEYLEALIGQLGESQQGHRAFDLFTDIFWRVTAWGEGDNSWLGALMRATQAQAVAVRFSAARAASHMFFKEKVP
jgi:hypothetical protein